MVKPTLFFQMTIYLGSIFGALISGKAVSTFAYFSKILLSTKVSVS